MLGRIAALGEIARAVGAPEFTNTGLLLVATVGILITLAQLVLLRRQLRLDTLIKIIDSNRAIVSVGIDHPDVWPTLEDWASTGVLYCLHPSALIQPSTRFSRPRGSRPNIHSND